MTMAAPTNHWKLGLFVVAGFFIAMGVVVALGARSLEKATVTYRSYFDESVQGLDVGSPVKFRGVTIGSVSAIGVAPDHKHVEVRCDLVVDELNDLGLNVVGDRAPRIAVPPELRVQLGSAGITGVKFVLIDFFSIPDNPIMPLPFPVPDNYIPSARSTMKNLEDSVVHAVDRFPEVAGQIVLVLGKMNRILDDVDSHHLPDKLGAALSHADRVMGDVQIAVRGVNSPKLAADADETMANLNVTVTRMNAMLERVQGDKGLLASAERASNAVGDVAQNANGLGREVEETLRDVQQAADTIQRLGDALEKDSDMLLKGRSRAAR
jgi:phospholipid/cholesterol/gamma-HCH transport system substrate-binding protein